MPDQHQRLASELIDQFARLTHKYNSLAKRGVDFGTGELLYQFEIHLIEAVGKGHGRTGHELAEYFAVTRGAVSQVAGKLEKKGYLSKSRNPNDGKEKLLSLTAKGRQAFAGHERMHRQWDRDLVAHLKSLPPDEVSHFQEVMDVIERHVDGYLSRL